MQVACVGERLVPAIGVLLLGIAGPLEVPERVRARRRPPPRITHGGKRTDELYLLKINLKCMPNLLKVYFSQDIFVIFLNLLLILSRQLYSYQ